jgi:hypothetical protein
MRSQLLGSIPSPNPRRLEASRAPIQGNDMVNSMSTMALLMIMLVTDEQIRGNGSKAWKRN